MLKMTTALRIRLKALVSRPEAYMVAMITEGIAILFSECCIIDDNWSDEIELTDEFIDTIISQIDEHGAINFNQERFYYGK